MRGVFPERVPFRLTRMLIKAMEVSGIEGTYRSTCERTMTVLRESRDSLVAMLEAFVYDPLISWRLIADRDRSENVDHILSGIKEKNSFVDENETGIIVSGIPLALKATIMEWHDDNQAYEGEQKSNLLNSKHKDCIPIPSHLTKESLSMRPTREPSFQMFSKIQALAANNSKDTRMRNTLGDAIPEHVTPVVGSITRSCMERRRRERLSLSTDDSGSVHHEALNEKALKAIRRVQDKLTGTDFQSHDGDPLDVFDQVQRLIVEGTSVENLCQHFDGWCAFW